MCHVSYNSIHTQPRHPEHGLGFDGIFFFTAASHMLRNAYNIYCHPFVSFFMQKMPEQCNLTGRPEYDVLIIPYWLTFWSTHVRMLVFIFIYLLVLLHVLLHIYALIL